MHRNGFIGFRICNKQTDLYILAKSDLSFLAEDIVAGLRLQLESYIAQHNQFLTSHIPVKAYETAPDIIREMANAAMLCTVGPMAAVAGAVSEAVAKQLLAHTDEIIIENGGDIFAYVKEKLTIGLYAHDDHFSNLKIKISADDMPTGICTSSGMFGHSFSYGKADAAVVLSKNAALADAAATRLCNEIQTKGDVDKTIDLSQSIPGLTGVLLIKDDVLGAWGDISLV